VSISDKANRPIPEAILFDLDGTLLDSAPDMLAAVNRLLAAHGMDRMTLERIRPHVSKGSRAMLAAAFPQSSDREREALVPDFLAAYQDEMGRHSRLFDGVESVLDTLESRGIRWGIVTNKPEYLARRVMPQLGWERRCAVLIGGDTLAHAKPHPLPLLAAAESLDAVPENCDYVGDDQRDIQAAQAAGMCSIAALWGYRSADELPMQWEADHSIEQPRDLLTLYWPL
jgi:phosphoglycolate phosphatase